MVGRLFLGLKYSLFSNMKAKIKYRIMGEPNVKKER